MTEVVRQAAGVEQEWIRRHSSDAFRSVTSVGTTSRATEQV